jgi:asparagine synthase (glutamine-hydrolysing)
VCGIAGYFNFKRGAVDPKALGRMNAAQKHRGPDDSGTIEMGTAGLAMVRLSVIDLPGGHQPMQTADGRLSIVFNGEIYNFRELRQELEKRGKRFRTQSDTEVILELFAEEGERCLERLNGMFAFCVHDRSDGSLFIARDRLGIKPLFYHRGKDFFCFASEIKALLECPVTPAVNEAAIFHYLSYNYLSAPWTPFAGIEHLPPGHCLKVTSDRFRIRKYWDIPLDENRDVGEEEACRTIYELLHRAVERQLVADVPVGAFLSGGVDSSSIVSLMKEHKEGKIHTFAVGFDDPRYDETPFARQVARLFDTEHRDIHCGPNDVLRYLPRLAWHADNLFGDQAALPQFILSQCAREDMKVTLSGDGGDELFIGYPTFHADSAHRLYAALPAILRHGLIEPAVRSLPASDGKVTFEYGLKKFVQTGDFGPDRAHYWWRTIFTDSEKRNLLRPEIVDRHRGHDSFEIYGEAFQAASDLNPLERSAYADLKVWLPGNHLYKVDSMTMAHGLETRVPFLDHELVEYVCRLPMAMKFRHGVLKRLLKTIMIRRLPDCILKRKKAGCHIPIAGWLKGPLKEQAARMLANPHPEMRRLFQPGALPGLLAEHLAGKRNNAFKIWGLWMMHHWCSRFFGSPNESEPEAAAVSRT